MHPEFLQKFISVRLPDDLPEVIHDRRATAVARRRALPEVGALAFDVESPAGDRSPAGLLRVCAAGRR
jgi:hypothetical protein